MSENVRKKLNGPIFNEISINSTESNAANNAPKVYQSLKIKLSIYVLISYTCLR